MKTFLTSALIVLTLYLSAQRMPYAVFGDSTEITLSEFEKKQVPGFEIINTDSTSDVSKLLFHFKYGLVEIYGANDEVIAIEPIKDGAMSRFISVDPLTAKYPHYTPYSFAGNKAIAYGDMEGLEEYFAADGTYLGKVGSSSEIRVLNSAWIIEEVQNFIHQANSDYDNGVAYSSANTSLFVSSEGINSTHTDAIQGVLQHYYEQAGFDVTELVDGQIFEETHPNYIASAGTGPQYGLEIGEFKISVDSDQFSKALINGEDVVNLFIHERGGHGEKFLEKLAEDPTFEYDMYGYAGEGEPFMDIFNAWEYDATWKQVTHDSWAGSSTEWKQTIYYAYGKDYVTGEIYHEFYFGQYGIEAENSDE